MTEDQAEAIANAAAKRAVLETLTAFGMDVESPRETQQDFAHLRKQRMASEKVGEWTTRALVGAVVSGGIAIFVIGLQHMKPFG